MSLDNLPVEWSKEQLGHIVNFIDYRGKTPTKTSEGIPLITAKNIRDGYINREPREYIAEDAYDEWMTRGIPYLGDLVITTEAPMGNVAVLNIQEKFALAQRAICLNFRYNQSISKFTYYYLRSQSFKADLQEKATGTTVQGIKAAELKKIFVPLAPLSEQQEIVRQLDMMLAQVEQIKARLDAIPAILKKFRQSVLESYFNNLASVQQVNLDDLVVSIDQGWSPKCLNTPASAEQWGVIKTSAIQPLYFDASENKELPSNLKPREALSLISGDVLITRAGPRARCGVTCIVDKDYDNLMICDKVYRVRCDSKKISADYLNLYLNSLTGLSLIEKMKTGSSESGMNLTQSKFKELVIPLVSLKQQLAFAKDIKKFFQLANHIEETVQSAQKRVNLLTQSILAKAFSGELTAEWREQHQELITGINSAESLLAKIQAEREASKPAKKTRKKKEV